MAVFWIPIAVPAWRRPEISAAAVNESPFQLMAATPPAISSGTAVGPPTAAANSRTPATAASRRNGSMRSSRRSDQRPADTRASAAPTCTPPSASAACAGAPVALAVEVEHEQRGDAHLADDHQRRGRAQPPDARVAGGVRRRRGRGLDARPVAQPDRRRDGREEHHPRERVERGVHARGGRQRRQREGGERRARGHGRLPEPEREPALVAREPAEDRPAARRDARRAEHPGQRHPGEQRHVAVRRPPRRASRARPRRGRTAITRRSLRRSESTPQASSVTTVPMAKAVNTAVTCTSERSKASWIAGAIAGSPPWTAASAAVAPDPTASTTQR